MGKQGRCLIKYCTDCTDGICLCPVLHYCPVLYNSSKSIRLNRHWDIFIKKYSDLFRAGILVTETGGQWTVGVVKIVFLHRFYTRGFKLKNTSCKLGH